MGHDQSSASTEPPKPLKQKVKEHKKEINELRRQNTREKNRLEYQGKAFQLDLKRKIAKKQPAASQKPIAQQILKNNRMIQKYNNIDSQLQNVTFELQQMCFTQSMQNVMEGMATIMSNANIRMARLDSNTTMKRFLTQRERMNAMNEYVQDIIGEDQEEIEDEDMDKLIKEMTAEQVAKHKKRLAIDLDDYQEKINDL